MKHVSGICFSAKYGRVHEGFKVIVSGVCVVFIIKNWINTLMSKMKKIRVSGAKKRRKIVEGNELGKNLFYEFCDYCWDPGSI